MRVFLLVCGALLSLLGGGCTVFWVGFLVDGGGPGGTFWDVAVFAFVLGILPLACGLLLIWMGLRKRNAATLDGDGT
jgi:hypothetical protein